MCRSRSEHKPNQVEGHKERSFHGTGRHEILRVLSFFQIVLVAAEHAVADTEGDIVSYFLRSAVGARFLSSSSVETVRGKIPGLSARAELRAVGGR